MRIGGVYYVFPILSPIGILRESSLTHSLLIGIIRLSVLTLRAESLQFALYAPRRNFCPVLAFAVKYRAFDL